jgi:uncharacterized membrane protein
MEKEPAAPSEKQAVVRDDNSEKDTAQKPEEDENQGMTSLHERTIATLSYAGFFAIVPFYLKKDSKFCRFHAKQGMLIALIFFFAKLLLVIDFVMDLALILQFAIFVWMGFAALSGEWKKMPWIYDMSCQLEDQLSLKTKDEEDEEGEFGPGEVKSE